MLVLLIIIYINICIDIFKENFTPNKSSILHFYRIIQKENGRTSRSPKTIKITGEQKYNINAIKY